MIYITEHSAGESGKTMKKNKWLKAAGSVVEIKNPQKCLAKGTYKNMDNLYRPACKSIYYVCWCAPPRDFAVTRTVKWH